MLEQINGQQTCTLHFKPAADINLSIRAALHGGPRLIHGFDNSISTNEIKKLMQINPKCYTYDERVENRIFIDL